MRVSLDIASIALTVGLAVGVTVGCGRDAGSPVSTSSPPPTSGAARPAEPATAGQLRTPPAGRVVSIGAAPEGIVVGRSGVGAVAVRNPDGVVLFTAATGVVRRRISTTAAARHLSPVSYTHLRAHET